MAHYSFSQFLDVKPDIGPVYQQMCYDGIPKIIRTNNLSSENTYAYFWQHFTNEYGWRDLYDPLVHGSYKNKELNVLNCGNESWTYNPKGGENQYRLYVYKPELISNTVRIISIPLLDPGIISGNQLLILNETPKLITGTDAKGDNKFTYQWEYSYDEINWIDISGAISKDYLPLLDNKTKYYRRKAIGLMCGTKISNISKVEILSTGNMFYIPDTSPAPARR